MIKILFLAANPKDMQWLQLDEEARTIKEVLHRAKHRDQFELKTEWAVRVTDLQQLLLDHQPHIVHFAGHSSAASEIILQDDAGQNVAVPPIALTQLFQTLKDNIRCIVLNACYSAGQAKAIAEHIDFVIGMSDAITDEAARHYATSFYQGLANGRTVAEAHDLGVGQIALTGLTDENMPQLLGAADPTQERLVGTPVIGSGIAKIKEDYLHLVAKKFSSLIPDEPGKTEINLADVFIMPNAYVTPWESLKTDSAPYEQQNQRSNARNKSSHQDLNKQQSAMKPRETALPELLRSHQHLMILGEPGAGKSTALEFICLCFCQPDKKMAERYLGLHEAYVPIFISLSRANPTGRLEEQLIEHLIDKYIPDEVAPKWLKRDRFVVLLDGLDEIPVEKRQQFLESVHTFIYSSYGQNCRLIITSRIGAYREIRLPSEPISLCTLSPLNDWDTAPRFVEKWLASIRKATPKDAKHEADELLKTIDSHSDLKKIKNSPLLLQLAVAVYVHSGELVSNRSDLYKLYIKDVLLKRAKRRNEQHVKIPLLFEGLCVIACLIQFQDTNTETELAEALEYVSGIDDGVAFLDFLRNDLGILTSFSEPFDKKYLFFHTTFREYFVARRLKRVWEDNEEQAWGLLRHRLHHNDWTEIILLMAGQMNKEQVNTFIRKILRNNNPYEHILHKDLLLVAAIIGEGNPVESGLCTNVIERLLVIFKDVSLPAREVPGKSTDMKIRGIKAAWIAFSTLCRKYVGINAMEGSGRHSLVKERVDEALIAVGRYYPAQLTLDLRNILNTDIRDEKRSTSSIYYYYGTVEFQQQQRAARILVGIGLAEQLIDFLRFESSKEAVLNAIDEVVPHDNAVRHRLLQQARNPDESVRKIIANFLTPQHGDEAIVTLFRLAEDESRTVRYAAFRNLRNLHGSNTQEALVILLNALANDKDLWNVADALNDISESIQEISILGKGVYSQVLISIYAIRNLATALKDTRSASYLAVNELIKEGYRSTEAIDALISIVNDNRVNGNLKEAIVWILAILGEGNPEMLPQLIRTMVRIKDWSNCYSAPEKALIKWSESYPQIVLQHIFMQGIQPRLISIVGKLARARIPGAMELLIDCLNTEEIRVKESVLDAIGYSGVNSSEVVELLERMLAIEDDYIIFYIHQALWHLNERLPDTVAYMIDNFVKSLRVDTDSLYLDSLDTIEFARELWETDVTIPEVIEVLMKYCVYYWDTVISDEVAISLIPQLWENDQSISEVILVHFINESTKYKYSIYAAEIVGYFQLISDQLREAISKRVIENSKYNESFIWALGRIAPNYFNLTVDKVLFDFLRDTQTLICQDYYPLHMMRSNLQTEHGIYDVVSKIVSFFSKARKFFFDWKDSEYQELDISDIDLSAFISASANNSSRNFSQTHDIQILKSKYHTVLLTLGYVGKDSAQISSILQQNLILDDNDTNRVAAVALAMHGEYSLQIVKHLLYYWKPRPGSIPESLIIQDIYNQGALSLQNLIRDYPTEVLRILLHCVRTGDSVAADVVITYFLNNLNRKEARIIMDYLCKKLHASHDADNFFEAERVYEIIDRAVDQITRKQLAESPVNTSFIT